MDCIVLAVFSKEGGDTSIARSQWFVSLLLTVVSKEVSASQVPNRLKSLNWDSAAKKVRHETPGV